MEAFLAAADDKSDAEAELIINAASRLQMDLSVLKETKIGRSLSAFRKKMKSPQLRHEAERLLSRWKLLVKL
jgi:hypothetical protein